MKFWSDHKTKILGGLISAAGYLSAVTAAGTFMGIFEPNTITLIGVGCGLVIAMFGHGTTAAGMSNTTRERVAAEQAKIEIAKADQAHEMAIAIKASPGGKTP